MKVVYSPAHALHRPRSFIKAGQVTPTPEVAERATRIASALGEAGFEFVAPRDCGLGPVLAVHDADLISFLADGYAPGARCPARLRRSCPTFTPVPAFAIVQRASWARRGITRRTQLVRSSPAPGRPRWARRRVPSRRRNWCAGQRCRLRFVPAAWAPCNGGSRRRLLLSQQCRDRGPVAAKAIRSRSDRRHRCSSRQWHPGDLLRPWRCTCSPRSMRTPPASTRTFRELWANAEPAKGRVPISTCRSRSAVATPRCFRPRRGLGRSA